MLQSRREFLKKSASATLLSAIIPGGVFLAYDEKAVGCSQEQFTVSPEATITKQNPRVTGLSTGFHGLDALTSGYQPSDLIVVAGRTKAGMTAFCVQTSLHAAIMSSTPVAMFPLVDNACDIQNRLICILGKIESPRLKQQKLSREEHARLTEASRIISKSPLHIDDTADLYFDKFREQCLTMKIHKNIGIVITGWYFLMRLVPTSLSDLDKSARLLRSLKELARELGIPIIVTAPVRRTVEARDDKRPRLSDLSAYYCNGVEEYADVVMLLYRDELYNTRADNLHKGTAEIIVCKNRNGAIGSVNVGFNTSQGAFAAI